MRSVAGEGGGEGIYAVWQVKGQGEKERAHVDTGNFLLVQQTFLFLQVMQQFPLSFQFNERFLHALFTHSYSSQYGKCNTLAGQSSL